MTPKDECGDVMNVLLQAVQHLLEKNHEFYPAGAVMNPDGSVAFSATYDGSEHPSSREVIDFLVKEHKNLADQNKIKVSAIAYDARVPIAGKKTDCIIMNLEHQSGYSVTVGMPYSFSFFQKSQLPGVIRHAGES